MNEAGKKINWIAYVLAWSKYAGEVLIRVSNLGNVIRESFADIHRPKEDEFTS